MNYFKIWILTFLIVCLCSTVNSNQQMHTSGEAQTLSSATSYILLWGSEVGATTDNDRVSVPIPTAGLVSNLRIVMTNGPSTLVPTGSLQTATFTLIVNTLPTALTCTLTELETQCCDITNAVSVSPGDMVQLQYLPVNVNSANPLTPGYWSVRFQASDATHQAMFGGADGAVLDALGQRFLSLHGYAGTECTIAARPATIFPTSGTLKNFYVGGACSVPGAATRTFTVRKNGVDTSLGCTVSSSSTTCNDTSDSVSVVAGDEVVVRATSTTSNPCFPRFGVVFAPDTAGEFVIATSGDVNSVISGSAGDAPSTTDTEYFRVSANAIQFLANEKQTSSPFQNVVSLAQSCDVLGLYVSLTDAPDNGAGTQDYTVTLRVNQADSILSCTVSETATTCSDSGTLVLNDDDELSYSITPSGTPATTRVRASVYLNNCVASEAGTCGGDSGDWGWTHRP